MHVVNYGIIAAKVVNDLLSNLYEVNNFLADVRELMWSSFLVCETTFFSVMSPHEYIRRISAFALSYMIWNEYV